MTFTRAELRATAEEVEGVLRVEVHAGHACVALFACPIDVAEQDLLRAIFLTINAAIGSFWLEKAESHGRALHLVPSPKPQAANDA